ncbi:flagellar hook-basal body complex protein FliE [Paracraurococcus ruber]|uniref:Flagellar hook-basal body protein FliE n=1 Tax=Paracraurococcus ruber TaxID=77675 RepID=A0ABS1D0N4_9PROT|nr:flagellar hook-basal body complex protein FliE [Paracraurococcus ruber]MBK1660036.1 flagellar hook-basal body protein FliE [Paracraurococcus ruber]TDG28619.1 flagellar hook-basal body protein FliE [Paracraurococcus ruber]
MTPQTAAIQPVSVAMRAYGAQAATRSDFGSMVGDAARGALNTLRQSETTSARGVAGTADVQEVVQAAASAELTVQVVSQLRDRALAAYSDILRMAV